MTGNIANVDVDFYGLVIDWHACIVIYHEDRKLRKMIYIYCDLILFYDAAFNFHP
ncbi:hypothetical protein D3C73_1581860 [compost metagenome]